MFCRTSDPVRDAEESQRVTRPVYTHCEACGAPIYGGDALDYGDPYYEMPDKNVCAGCIEGYLMERRREAPCL